MVDLCLHQTSRSLGSTIELHRNFANLCQVSLFPCVLVHDCNDCAYAVCHLLTCACCKLWSRVVLGITCPQRHVLPFPCQTYWLKLVVLDVARVLVFVLFFSLHLLHCFVPSLLTTVSQIGLLTICTWRFDSWTGGRVWAVVCSHSQHSGKICCFLLWW